LAEKHLLEGRLAGAARNGLPEERKLLMNVLRGFDELSAFRLMDHGDRRERRLWAFASGELSDYEVFWRTLIVPLTNRVDPTIEFGSESWFRLRRHLPRVYEDVAMSSYSVLYYAASALEQISIVRSQVDLNQHSQLELPFFLLQVCVANVKTLHATSRQLLGKLHAPCNLPKHPEKVYRVIGAYRNAFTHDPVIGRATTHGRETIPPIEVLPRAGANRQFLRWSQTEAIPSDRMVDGLECLEGIWNQLTEFLQKLWSALPLASRQLAPRKHFSVRRVSGRYHPIL
jgi:hypothetical protein